MTNALACPYCGTDTPIARAPEPELGTLSIDEAEVLVRNEWRRLLGPAAYVHAQSPALVRALLVYALRPESPVRSHVAGVLLYRELMKFGAMGATQASIQMQLTMLPVALTGVLRASGLDARRRERIVAPLTAKVRETLGWSVTV